MEKSRLEIGGTLASRVVRRAGKNRSGNEISAIHVWFSLAVGAPYLRRFEPAVLTRRSAYFASLGPRDKGLAMNIRPLLAVIFLLVMASGMIEGGIQHGHFVRTLPSLVIPLLIIAFAVWREWKVATDAHFAAHQAKIDSLPWEEAFFAAMMFFVSCIVLFVPLVAIASLHPETFQHIDFETMLVLPLFIAPVGAVVVWICRFFWWR
jgi:hypothetical protein